MATRQEILAALNEAKAKRDEAEEQMRYWMNLAHRHNSHEEATSDSWAKLKEQYERDIHRLERLLRGL